MRLLQNGVLTNDAGTKLQGFKNPDNSDSFFVTMDTAPLNMTTKSIVLNGAVAGENSGWLPTAAYPERLGYALDSGSTTTTFSIDISANGITSLSQAFTGSWASSTLAEISPPLLFSDINAKYFRINVLTGGPISFIRGV